MAGQIDWSDTPTPVAAGSRQELIRCGIGSLPPLICICRRHKGGEIHFWQGRSFPHLTEGCPACAAKNIAHWKGYIGVWNPATRLTGILEFTLPCLSALDAYFLAHGTCRGATLTLKRKGIKPNGPLSLTATPSQWGHDQLPPDPDLKGQLEFMWGAKRVDDFIKVEPTRAVVEPPANPDEAALRRRNTAAACPGVDVDEATMGLGDVAKILANRLTLGTPANNGKAGHK